jgi:small subunit ribosomal protein S21
MPGDIRPANRQIAVLLYGVPRVRKDHTGDKSRGKGVSSLADVKIQEGESIESALRRFKRKVQQEDIIKDIKKHSFYLKPGDKRRAKQALARKRSRKKQRRDVE